MEQQAILNN